MSLYPHNAEAERLGQGLQGLRDAPEHSLVAWTPAKDSVTIRVVGLGSLGWTLVRRRERLRGIAWRTFDVVDLVDTLGPATGRRAHCP
jgi:hypothetical protein